MADIATRIGRTREGVRLLITGARGTRWVSPRRLPTPAVATAFGAGRTWCSGSTKHFGENLADEGDEILAAFNAGLELRHHRRRLAPSDQARLAALAGL